MTTFDTLPSIAVAFAFLITGHNIGLCKPMSQRLRALTLHWRGYLGFCLIAIAGIAAFPGAGDLSVTVLEWVIFLNLGWIAASVLWADNKMLSLRRVAQFEICAGAALCFATALSLDQRVWLITMCSGLFILVGFAVSLARPRFFDVKTGRYVGTTLATREAINITLFIISVCYLAARGEVTETVGLGLVVAVVPLLIMTGARAPIWTGFLVMLSWPAISLEHPGETTWLLWVVPLIYVATTVVTNWSSSKRHENAQYWIKKNPIKSVFHVGRSPENVRQLTGRLPLWRNVLRDGQERWLAGFGHGSFFTPERSPRMAEWEPTASHSVYLDSFVHTGIVGLSLLAALFVVLIVDVSGLPYVTAQFLFLIIGFVGIVSLVDSAFILGEYETFVFLLLIFNLH